MKQWMKTLPVKIISFILCMISMGVTAAAVCGAVYMESGEFYTRSKEFLLNEAQENYAINSAQDLVYSFITAQGTPQAEHYINFTAEKWAAQNSNFRFAVVNGNGNVLMDNMNRSFTVENVRWTYTYPFENTLIDEEYWELRRLYPKDSAVTGTNPENVYTVYAYFEAGLPVHDKIALECKLIEFCYAMRYAVFGVMIGALGITVLCFVLLICTAGKRAGSTGLHPGPLNRVPLDLLVAGIGMLYVVAFGILSDAFYTIGVIEGAVFLLLALSAAAVVLGLSMSIAVRIRQKSLLKNTVIFRSFRWLKQAVVWTAKKIRSLFLKLPMLWRTLLAVAAVSLADFFIVVIAWDSLGAALVLLFLEKLVLAAVVVYAAWFLRKLQAGGAALANGNLSYKIDTNRMFWDFKRHGENLNNIAVGMSKAVEERLQSERMKTELITNVSHDIKNPLTSIINYAGLISEATCNSPEHAEYADVVVRKSKHLKHLLDDLIEVSKASTGNLEMVLAPCDAGVLMTQLSGEFEERCQKANLALIVKQAEEPLKIMADGRRIWRVFENLMSNACKYSLNGSRVYLNLERQENHAVFIFRNTSRDALNLSPDELMDRFVRGDSSRTTEGNGLGLSIAQSLTELQNGKLLVTIDGDLFKVTVSFPLIP